MATKASSSSVRHLISSTGGCPNPSTNIGAAGKPFDVRAVSDIRINHRARGTGPVGGRPTKSSAVAYLSAAFAICPREHQSGVPRGIPSPIELKMKLIKTNHHEISHRLHCSVCPLASFCSFPYCLLKSSCQRPLAPSQVDLGSPHCSCIPNNLKGWLKTWPNEVQLELRSEHQSPFPTFTTRISLNDSPI